jgi:uncharacterized protein (UPF0548 family)
VVSSKTALPGLNTVSLVQLSETEWRVSDPTVSAFDAGSLLGFVEAREERFLVTIMRPTVYTRSVSSLEGAVRLFAPRRESGAL